MKKCKLCNIEKPFEQFSMTHKGKYYNSACKQCHNEVYQKDSYKKSRESKLRACRKFQDKHDIDGVAVYLLPDFNYVGITKNMYKRLTTHKYQQNRFTDNYKILHVYKTRSEALAKEKEYHNMGYNG